MNHLVIFSAIFLAVASMSPILGYFALHLDFKGTINRLFMMICLCLTFWALGFSVVIIAPDEASGVFWTRFAAVGYEMIYSLLLHFTLVITGHKEILRKKWFCLLLYTPAAVCLYAFVFSPDIAETIYLLENTSRGWVRTTPPIIYDLIFNIYYVSAVLTSLILLALWKHKNTQHVTKQANILMLSFLFTFGLGTLTDIMNGSYFNFPIPPMAPLLFLIPLSAIFYCVDKYHFMKPLNVNSMEIILNDERRITVFQIGSNVMILGGITLFIMEYFWWKPDGTFLTVVSSAMLIILGMILRYAQFAKKGYSYLELLLVVTSVTVTPISMVNMMKVGAMSIWAFPIMLVVCSLIFNSSNMLLASSIPVITGQIYLIGIVPQAYVVLDYRTYISRIVVLLFITAVAYYTHRIYVGRLKENAAQTKTHALISNIATGFSLSSQDNMTAQIHNLLITLKDYFIVETVLLNIVESETIELVGIDQYSINNFKIPPELLSERWNIYYEEYFKKTKASQFENMKSIPWIFIPIYKAEKPVAFFYIETSRKENIWAKEQLVPLTIISRIVSDSLEKLNSEAHIHFMAYYDRLTGLPNRQLFHDRISQAIHTARRNNTIVGVMFLDLDSFKSINDTMGHDGGDMLIKAISKKLSDGLRKSDTVARFGGDEFLILINGITEVEHVSKIADKILAMFKEPVILKDQEIFVTASAGISLYPADGEDDETLIKHADIAMYTAKEKGKNQYSFCSSNMKETVKYKVNLTNNLYRALERNELQVYYQPQIDLQSEKIIGLEALLRWFHPKYGMVPPLEFISLAEQTGLINPIGSWVLETACAQAAAWKRMGFGNLRISVNLSVVQLRSPSLLSQVKQILDKTGVDPAQVELEITESTTTREPDYIIRVLNDLKGLGVSISIDDFGTEYSSLNRLKLLPVDSLKMDIQFVHGIDKSPKDQAISLVIINLAKNLDLKLIAEGVENRTQLDFLKNRKCDEVQGFYYYKPMPASEVENVLSGKNLNFSVHSM